MTEKESTYWNGLLTLAVRGTAVVAPAPQFRDYWAKSLIGARIEVVRVDLYGVVHGGGIMYIDNRDGSGWYKVTQGHGGPYYPHKQVIIDNFTFKKE